jgi:hypothetical protein
MLGPDRSSATSARDCSSGTRTPGHPSGAAPRRASGPARRRSWASQMRRHSSAQWSHANSSICVRTHIVIACAHTYFERGRWRSLCQSCCTCLRHPGGPRPNHWRLPRHSSTHSPTYVRISRSNTGTCGMARFRRSALLPQARKCRSWPDKSRAESRPRRGRQCTGRSSVSRRPTTTSSACRCGITAFRTSSSNSSTSSVSPAWSSDSMATPGTPA